MSLEAGLPLIPTTHHGCHLLRVHELPSGSALHLREQLVLADVVLGVLENQSILVHQRLEHLHTLRVSLRSQHGEKMVDFEHLLAQDRIIGSLQCESRHLHNR